MLTIMEFPEVFSRIEIAEPINILLNHLLNSINFCNFTANLLFCFYSEDEIEI